MSDFTASNGLLVKPGINDGGLAVTERLASNDAHQMFGRYELGTELVQGLREFFLHERDEQLGRWRDQMKPDRYVTVEREHPSRRIRVYDEMRNVYSSYEGMRGHMRRATEGDFALADTAIRWEQAHPEPKPWHEAKPGEVWLLNVDGEDDEAPGVVSSSESGYPLLTVATNDAGGTEEVDPRSDRITDGRRIWPEPEATS